MSLTSASTVVSGIKEYAYRGMQQLPIVLASTSLLFTVTTGSIAHANLFLGLSVLMPAYTFFLQSVLAFLMPLIFTKGIFWNRSTGDTCDLVAVPSARPIRLEQFKQDTATVPSFWMTSVAFFFGYAFSNIVDSINQVPAENASDVSKERRSYQTTFIAVNTAVLLALLLFIRLWFMRGCDGLGTGGIVISLLAALGAGGIGAGIYKMSKECGARSTDLFGVLSQMLPESAGTKHPIVCKAE